MFQRGTDYVALFKLKIWIQEHYHKNITTPTLLSSFSLLLTQWHALVFLIQGNKWCANFSFLSNLLFPHTVKFHKRAGTLTVTWIFLSLPLSSLFRSQWTQKFHGYSLLVAECNAFSNPYLFDLPIAYDAVECSQFF